MVTSFERYYRDELIYLRELGEEFGKAHNEIAWQLTKQSSDPDVERLLEGVAFLTARVRRRLDDEIPELSQTLLGILYPHYLRPVPATATVEFSPKADSVQERKRIPRETLLGCETDLSGTRCRFTTCYPVDVVPVELHDADLHHLRGKAAELRLGFRALERVDLAKVDLSTIRLHLTTGETSAEDARRWYRMLLRDADNVRLEWSMAGDSVAIQRTLGHPDTIVRQVGFECEGDDGGDAETSLLPYPSRSFPGYRILQEYLAFPDKFLYLDLQLGDAGDSLFGNSKAVERFDLFFRFPEYPKDAPPVRPGSFRLHCSPAVNLFPSDGKPLTIDHSKAEYLVRADADRPRDYEIFSLEEVNVLREEPIRVPEFYSFDVPHLRGRAQSLYYETRYRTATTGSTPDGPENESLAPRKPRLEMAIRFVQGDGELFDAATNEGVPGGLRLAPSERMSLDLRCTNGDLPNQLAAEDIRRPDRETPEWVTFEGIGDMAPAIDPPVDQGILWKLISHLSLNYLSLSNHETLRGLLEVYDFVFARDERARVRHARRLEGIREVGSEVVDGIHGGYAVKIVETRVDVDESFFEGEGDVFLFGCVLDHFLSMYVAANSFSRLTLHERGKGRRTRYPARAGREILL